MPDVLEPQPVESASTKTTAPPVANVAIKIDSLITGRKLEHPIYDMQGVLLLSAGSLITPQVRQKLADRRIDQVSVSPADAASVTVDADLFEDNGAALSFDS